MRLDGTETTGKAKDQPQADKVTFHGTSSMVKDHYLADIAGALKGIDMPLISSRLACYLKWPLWGGRLNHTSAKRGYRREKTRTIRRYGADYRALRKEGDRQDRHI